MSEIVPGEQFLVYRDEQGNARIDVRFVGDKVWLSQDQLVAPFDSSKANASEHISNIFSESELLPQATVRDVRTVRQEGHRRVTYTFTTGMIQPLLMGRVRLQMAA